MGLSGVGGNGRRRCLLSVKTMEINVLDAENVATGPTTAPVLTINYRSVGCYLCNRSAF